MAMATAPGRGGERGEISLWGPRKAPRSGEGGPAAAPSPPNPRPPHHRLVVMLLDGSVAKCQGRHRHEELQEAEDDQDGIQPVAQHLPGGGGGGGRILLAAPSQRRSRPAASGTLRFYLALRPEAPFGLELELHGGLAARDVASDGRGVEEGGHQRAQEDPRVHHTAGLDLCQGTEVWSHLGWGFVPPSLAAGDPLTSKTLSLLSLSTSSEPETRSCSRSRGRRGSAARHPLAVTHPSRPGASPAASRAAPKLGGYEGALVTMGSAP